MRSFVRGLIVASAALATVSVAYAQRGPGGPGQGGQGGGPGGGGPGGPGGGPGGMRGMRANDQLMPFIAVLADVNLRPDFNLSQEQETQIATIRQQFKTKMDAWRAANKDKLDEIQETLADLREQGPDADREAMRAAMDEMRELMSTAPNGEAEVNAIKALLTADQKKAIDERQQEMQREQPQGPGGPGGRGPNGPPPGGPQGGDGNAGGNPPRN